jgi:hypothetical protein
MSRNIHTIPSPRMIIFLMQNLVYYVIIGISYILGGTVELCQGKLHKQRQQNHTEEHSREAFLRHVKDYVHTYDITVYSKMDIRALPLIFLISVSNGKYIAATQTFITRSPGLSFIY